MFTFDLVVRGGMQRGDANIRTHQDLNLFMQAIPIPRLNTPPEEQLGKWRTVPERDTISVEEHKQFDDVLSFVAHLASLA